MHGFPAALTSFIGRGEAVRDVAGLLEECRLVTVTGSGGMGKTRLACQVARQAAARFDDGAWLAELAPVRDPAQVAAAVAAALGIRERPGTPHQRPAHGTAYLSVFAETSHALLARLGTVH
jgi:predicted ATPase